jgi:ABC-type dipeptide/oligopeptide/nickel transport system permease component
LWFAARRCALGLATLFGVALLAFVLVHLSGDPINVMLEGTIATEEYVASLRKEFGYDQPLPVQFLRFIQGAVRGDVGISLRFRQPAMDLVLERLPATIELAVAAMTVALLVAVPLGISAAIRRGTLVDRACMLVTLLGMSIPLFWLGISLILLLAVKLRWLPAAGRGTLDQLILPAITLATYPMGRIARITRSSMLEVLGLDYVRTARSKGLSERLVIYSHALRNAMLPVITLVALQFGNLLGGAIVTEAIFSWPGVGQLALQAASTRDLPLVQASVLVTGTIFIVINSVVDLLYGYLDPRIRLE